MQDIEQKYNLLKLLEQKPDATQRQMAEALGISLGKTHYLVKSLIDTGWIKFGNFKKSNNKLGYVYLLTPAGVVEKAAITVRFLNRKKKEFDALQMEIAQLQKEIHQHQLKGKQ